MANKTPFYASAPLDPTDRILYVEVSPGVYALATASIVISGVDANPEPALTDEITGALVTIPVIHHEVHEGETFSTSLFSLVNANGADITVLLRTGSTHYGHLTFTTSGGGDAQVRLLEAPTIQAVGNAMAIYNMKRYSTDTPEIQAFANPTYIDGASIPTNFLVPGGSGGNSQGGISRPSTEWILSLNTDYVIELTNIAVGNQPLSIVMQWYE
jgi:hypothetical protein